MRNHKLFCIAVFSLTLAGLLSVAALGQSTNATISGTVSDETGGVVPGVEVLVTHLDRGTTRTIVSDDEGRYSAPELQLGSYQVEAALTGFQTAVRTGITLTVGRHAVVDLVLSIGEISERVVVTGEVATVETTSSTISGLVDAKKIRDLPLNGRSFTDLALLQMGVAKLNIIATGQGSTSGFGTKISISGARPSANSFLLDGNFVNDTMNNTPAGATGHFLGVETLREFSVLTNTYSAEYGQSMGGIINAVTKSGTNQLHGSAFYFHRNDNVDARNFFDPGESPPEFRRHQFGGTIGGPIVPNKTFIFGGYEGLREALGRTLIGGTLTDEARQGIFPLRTDASGNANCDELIPFGGFLDSGLNRCVVPLGGATEPGGPTIADYMIFFPPVNSAVPRIPEDGIGEYILSRSRVSNQDNFVIKVDHNFSDSDSFFARYTFDEAEENNPGTNFAGIFKTRNQYVTLEEKHIFSPTLLNVVRVGYNRNALTQTDVPNFDFPENLQQVPTGRSVLPEFQAGLLGVFTPPGTSGIGGSSITPRIYRTNLFEYADNLSWSSGRHSVKTGFNLKRVQANLVSPQRTFGSMQFTSFFHFISGGQTLGSAGSLSFPIAGGNVERGIRYWVMGFFVQDDYQIRPNLTLNLGLRYEPSTGHSEVNGKLSAMINLRTDLETTLVEHSFKNPTKKNFAPRIGFAWDPFGDGKTSLRAGFGLFYNIQMSEIDRISTTSNAPFTPLGNPPVLYPIPFEACCTPEVLASNPNATTSLELIDWNAPQSYRMQWNLNVQRELVADTTLTVGYVGSRGVDLFRVFQKNSADPVDPSQCGPTDGPTCVNPMPERSSFYFPVCRPGGPGGITCDRPDNSYLFGNSCANFSVWPDNSPFRCHRLNPKFQTAIMRSGGAGSTYHALQLSLNKRFSSGFQIQGSYTWSHSIDNSSKQIRGPGESAQTASQQNSFDTPAEKGNSNFDVTHNFTLNFTVDLPGQDMAGAARHILGGWQVGSIMTLASGVPQTIVLGYDNCRCINGEIFGVSTTDNRPDLISGGDQNPVLGDGREPTKYYDSSQFEAAPAGFYGQLGRNTLRIPGVAQFDFSLIKKMLVAEGTEVQFRAEFFNMFNRANFGSPGTRLFSRAGTPVRADAGRISQTTTTSRQIQFALKILF